jgi:hypothetical protein
MRTAYTAMYAYCTNCQACVLHTAIQAYSDAVEWNDGKDGWKGGYIYMYWDKERIASVGTKARDAWWPYKLGTGRNC